MQAHPTMEILPFRDAYLVAGCLVLKGLSPRGAVPKGLGCSGSRQTTPGAVSRLGGWPQELLESHLVTSHPFSQPHTVLAHWVCKQAWAAQLRKVLAEVGPPALAKQPRTPGCWHGWDGHGSPGSRSSFGLGILPAAPGALLTPWASGTAAKCSLSVLGRYGRMRAE